MDPAKHAEEMLREAACFGDEDGVKNLIKAGVNVNVQHSVNGWTPLHWATKRGHASIVCYLLNCGADINIKSVRGETPVELAPNDEIKELLTSGKLETHNEKPVSSPLPITPNYIAHPPLAHKVDIPESNLQRKLDTKSLTDEHKIINSEQELIVKVRTSNPPNQDFIEVEIPQKDLLFSNVLKICCEELEVNIQKVVKLRKLPNTMLRKDKDVQRLKDFTELEIVLQPDCYSHSNAIGSNSTEMNGFLKNVSTVNKNSEKDSSPIYEKSSFCRNGKILY